MELYLNDVYPYAQQISNYIEREIFQQKLKAGQKLLSITNLSKELNVSKHTIQLSYKILRKKELIVKKGNDFFVGIFKRTNKILDFKKIRNFKISSISSIRHCIVFCCKGA